MCLTLTCRALRFHTYVCCAERLLTVVPFYSRRRQLSRKYSWPLEPDSSQRDDDGSRSLDEFKCTHGSQCGRNGRRQSGCTVQRCSLLHLLSWHSSCSVLHQRGAQSSGSTLLIVETLYLYQFTFLFRNLFYERLEVSRKTISGVIVRKTTNFAVHLSFPFPAPIVDLGACS